MTFLISQAQPPTSPTQVNQNTWYRDINNKYWIFSGGVFGWRQMVDSTQLTTASLITGFTVTSIPTLGQVVTTGTPNNVIKQLFNQTQAPTAALSGGTVNEFTSASTATFTLNWTAGRQSATNPLQSVVITGNSQTYPQTFSNPSAGSSTSGTQSVTAPTNVSTTYTLTVTTDDNKTATASTTRSYANNRYWGRSATNVPSNGGILAVAGGGTDLNNSRTKSGFVVTSSGSNYIYYAYPASAGDLTSLTVGGFESLPAFTKNIISVTNASGYVTSFNVYVSNNTFSATTPTIIAQ